MTDERGQGRKTSRAIVRVATEAVTRAAGPVASIAGTVQGIPLLGPGVSLTAALPWLGYRVAGAWHSKRVRNAVQRALLNDDWSALYREQLKAGGADRLRRELLEMLRDLDNAVSDAAVEPLTRPFQHRARGTASWAVVRALAAALRRLTDGELAKLQAMLSIALQNCTGSPLSFITTLSIKDARPVLLVSSEFGGQLEAPGVGDATDVLRMLVSSGVAAPHSSSQPQATAFDMPASEGIALERPHAEFIVSLFE